MDAFSYLSVLLSVIIGLGISQLLTSFGRLIRHRDIVRSYWPSLLWAGVLLLIFIPVVVGDVRASPLQPTGPFSRSRSCCCRQLRCT